MINKGELLRKPGESEYSRYRRFLIANHGICNRVEKVRYSLLKSTGLKISRASGMYDNINLLNMLEHDSTGNKLKPIKARFIRVYKNCPSCSEIGYHCDPFNEEWMTTCPIHNLKLLKYCHICSQKWPSSSKIISSNCKGCGAKISFRELARKGAFLSCKPYTDIEYLYKVYNSKNERKSYLLEWKTEPFNTSSSYGVANCNSPFTPTAIASWHQNKNKHLKRLSDLGIRVFDYTMIQFLQRDYVEDSNKGLSEEQKNTIKKEVYSTLKKDIKHKFSQCFTNKKGNNCSFCRAMILFKKLNEIDTENEMLNEQFFFNIRFEIEHIYGLPEPVAAKVLHRISISSGSMSGDIKRVLVPVNIQKKLYEFELYACFCHSFMLMEHIKKCSEKLNCNQLDSYSLAPKAIRQETLVKQIYYIYDNDDEIFITIPNVLKKPTQIIGHELFY